MRLPGRPAPAPTHATASSSPGGVGRGHGVRAFAVAALASVALMGFGATAQAQTEVWSGTLTVQDLDNILGCSNAIEGARCRDTAILTDDDFTYDSTDYAVHNLFLYVGPAGRLAISFIPDLAPAAQALTLDVAGTTFAFEDADVQEARQRVWASTGLSWSGGDTVAVKLTETPTSTNNAPKFAQGTSTTRRVAENTAAGTNIGVVVAARDADSGDTLEYTLGGTDMASFAIVSTSGQLQTQAALDFETTSSYAVTVAVSDGNGGSDSIDVTIIVTDVAEQPATPAAPTVSATANSHTSLDVSWTAPGLNGGPALTGYDLRYRPGTSGPWTNGPQNVSGTSAAITGLAAGTSYQVQARALNGETPSDWSSAGTGSTSSAPATAPGVPRTLTATAGDGQVVLRWTAPASDGGEAITRYEYRHKATSSLPFVSSDSWTSAGTARTATVGSLTNATPYSFAVRAVNTVGAGTAATASATPMAAATPGIRVSTTMLSVEEGAFRGNSYTVRLDTQPTGNVTVTITGQAGTNLTVISSPLTFTSTDWNQEQTVRLGASADNNPAEETVTLRHAATGGGYDSVAPVEVRVTITQPATAPGVPRTLTATPGDGAVVLTWTAPASDGGETITRYEYRHKATSSLPFVSSDSWTSAGTARTATVGSLTNGTPYSFAVRAVNTVGGGTAATTSATPTATATTPGVPRTLTATSGDGQVVLRWTVPASDGGETITRYEHRHKVTSAANFPPTWTSAGTATTATVGSLTNGTPYSFAVRAVNTVGEGTAATANATPLATARATNPALTLAVAPTRVGEAAGSARICVVPSAPSSQRITVQAATADGTATAPGDYGSHSGTVALEPQQQRACFFVTLVDDAAVEGDETFTVTLSNPANATLGTPHVATVTIVDNDGAPDPEPPPPPPAPDPPPAPRGIVVTPGDRQVTVTWSPVWGADRYVVEWKTASQPYSSLRRQVVDPPAHELVIDAVENGTPYTVRVQARNDGGLGAWSTEVTSTPDNGTAPMFERAEVKGKILYVTFDEALDAGSQPAGRAFTVSGGRTGTGRAAVSGVTVTVTLDAAVAPGETVTVSYTTPDSHPLRDLAEREVASFTGQPVTNTTLDTPAPTVERAAVDGNTLTVTFDEALDAGSQPAGRAFTVSGGRTGTGRAAVSGVTVTVTLDAAVASGETVTVSYTTPDSHPLRDADGNAVASFTGQPVTNTTPTPVPALPIAAAVGLGVLLLGMGRRALRARADRRR